MTAPFDYSGDFPGNETTREPTITLADTDSTTTCPYCHGRHSTRQAFTKCRAEYTDSDWLAE